MTKHHDDKYSPLVPSDPEYRVAVEARREMLKILDSIPTPVIIKRKTWHERMVLKARGFKDRTKMGVREKLLSEKLIST